MSVIELNPALVEKLRNSAKAHDQSIENFLDNLLQRNEKSTEPAFELADLFRSVVENMNEGVFVVKSNGEVIASNPTGEAIFGLNSAEIRQLGLLNPYWSLLNLDGTPLPPAETPFSQTLSSGKSQYNLIVGVHRPNQHIVWLMVNSFPLIRPNSSEVETVVLIFNDITLQKNLLDQLTFQRDLANQLNMLDDPQAIFDKCLDATLAMLNMNKGGLYLRDEKTGDYNLAVYRGPETEVPASVQKPRNANSLLAEIVAQRQIRLLSPQQTKDYETTRDLNIQMTIVVPLIFQDEPIGAFILETDQEYREQYNYTALLEGITMQVEGALGRARAKSALLDSQRLYMDLYDNAPDMYLSLDIQTRQIIQCNQTLANRMGYSKEELIGQSVTLIYSPATEAVAQSLREELLRTGKPRDYLETQLVTRHGEIIDVSVKATVFKDDDGTLIYSRSILRDITTSKKIEATLYFIAQQGWKISGTTFLETIATYLAQILDVEYVFIDEFNPAKPTVVQTRVAYVDGRIVGNIEYALADTPCAEVLTQNLVAYPQNVQRLFPNDALLVDLRAEAYAGIPLWDSKGNSIGLIALISRKPMLNEELMRSILQIVAVRVAHELEQIIHENALEALVAKRTQQLRQEVHEHTKTEALLIAEKHQTELIIRNVADAVLFMDVEGRILYANPAWERMTGYSREEFQGVHLQFFESGQTPTATYQHMWSRVLAGNTWTGIHFYITKQGIIFDALSTLVPIEDVRGKITHIVSVHRDITQERQLAQMKQEFIANAAHDLRTPVTVMQTSLYLLKKDPTTLDKRLVIFEQQVGRLRALLEDLLTLARLDQHADAPPRQTDFIQLDNLIHEVIAAQQLIADEKQVSLTFEPVPHLPGIWGDKVQVERAVVNLVANAVNYTPSGGSVGVTTRVLEKFISLEVSDTGIGISADDLPHIFDRFFRSPNAKKMGSTGTGLGLAIVKEIVEQHHGKVSVSSRLGEGSQFEMLLPYNPHDAFPL